MPDKKLTDSEIVKALEECVNGGGCESCKLYSLESPPCNKYALDLINRLQEKLDEAEDTIQFADKELKKAEAENERLKDYNENLQTANTALSEEILEAKAEAYKECIEKVKDNSNKMELVCSGALVRTDYTITKEKLDNLLKEMVGDTNV